MEQGGAALIDVDYRKGSIELLPLFAAHSITAASAVLASGDFAFWGNDREDAPIRVGVERKTIPDLIQSFRDERLAGGQLPKLFADYGAVYLFVEGPMRRSFREEGMVEYKVETPQGGYTEWTVGFGQAENWYHLMNRLCDLEDCGVRLRFPGSRKETAALVHQLYQQWSKPASARQSHSAIKHVDVEKEASWTAKCARALGLGHAAARRAEKVFLSPRHLMNALPEVLLGEGVVQSKAMATKIANRSHGVESK